MEENTLQKPLTDWRTSSSSSIDALRRTTDENRRLRQQLRALQQQLNELNTENKQERPSVYGDFFDRCALIPEHEKHLTIVVFGASGDLAKKKTYPALYTLYTMGLLPKKFCVVGYARSKIPLEDFRNRISCVFSQRKGYDHEKGNIFLARCHYISGSYTELESFQKLQSCIETLEEKNKDVNRLCYMAIPPNIFLSTCKNASKTMQPSCGWLRVVVEKPFGHDLASARELSESLGHVFEEKQLFRIDHYLGKELIQNMMILSFANAMFEPLWNHFYIKCVVITFKEDIGLEGRAGYFERVGIIRDVIQNHLMQVFSLIAMETPVSLSADDVRDEKVKVLRSTLPLHSDDLIVGQYSESKPGKKDGYLDESDVDNDSRTPTYAMTILKVANARWQGVPFILKAAKGVNERKAEVRIQFKKPPANLFANVPEQELVMRIQPSEAIYFKLMTKQPGLTTALFQSELDMTFHDRFEGAVLPDAYERLIYDVIRGDQNSFVRRDELEAAWKVFDQALSMENAMEPIQYRRGSRGPVEADELAEQYGFQYSRGYSWPKM